MDDPIKYPWQQAVLDAFMSAPRDLATKINIAERGISARLAQPDAMDLAERIALKDALRALKVLISGAQAAERRRAQESTDKEQKDKNIA